MGVRLRVRVNGQTRSAEIEPRLVLSDFLRHTLGLTGTHVGCEMGACGACTVLLDGEPIRACLLLAVQASGRDVRTVESLGRPEALHPLQAAFAAHHGLQCGYCTPGILMSVVSLAERGALPDTEAGVRDALGGHLCRCTGYQGIVDAVLACARATRGRPVEPAPAGRARREDAALLTGRGRYAGDLARAGMLEAAFVRSPHAHARIRGIDVTEARVGGALLVLTAVDLPFADRELVVRRWHPAIRGGKPPALARDVVRHVGEAVALVVAPSRAEAEDLAERIRVDYEPLPAVATPEAAMREGVPRVSAAWDGNVAARLEQRVGDAPSALAAAPRRLRRTFRMPRQVPLPLETRGCLAEPGSPAGGLTLWASTQVAYHTRANLAALLDLPEDLVRVVTPDVGGGFGGKSRTYWEEILVAHAALRLGGPVRWIEDRLEHMTASTHSRDVEVDLEVGYGDDGRLAAVRARLVVDVGAYVHGNGVITAEVAGAQVPGPYRLPHYQAEILCVGTHKTPLGTHRGAGQPEGAFPMERMLGLIAKDLGMDPAAVRRVNLVTPAELPYAPGTILAGARAVYESGDFPAVLARAIELAQARSAASGAAPGELVGTGLALGLEVTGFGGPESARVTVDPDGAVEVRSGLTTQGQGHATMLAAVCAETLGVPPECVTVRLGDTALLPTGRGTFASRGAVAGANAVADAAARVRETARRAAARLLEASPDDVVLAGGRIYPRGSPGRAVSLGDVARALGPGGPLGGPGAPGLTADAVAGPASEQGTYALSAHVATVAVDPATGVTRVLDYVVVHDVGRHLDDRIVEGQVVGGVVEGLGGALLSEMRHDDSGQLLTGTLMDYLVPTAEGLPRIRMDHLETRAGTNALGVRGVGEGGTIPVAAAVANAVGRALGPGLHAGEDLLCELPLTPERVLHALRAAGMARSG